MAEECKHKLSKIPFHLFIIILSRIIKKAIFYIFFLKTARVFLFIMLEKRAFNYFIFPFRKIRISQKLSCTHID